MPRVAVAGAGIGGVAAALALARSGCEVSVYERSPQVREAGAGVQLSSNAVAALRKLGVLDAVRQQAVELDSLNIGRGRDGRILAKLPLGETARQRFGAPFLVSLRADLHRALLDAALARPEIQLEPGRGVSGWSPAAGRLELTVSGPRPGTVAVDGLVGADGLHSTVRRRLHPSDRAIYGGRTAWRTVIEVAHLPPGFAEARSHLWMGRSAHLVHYPVDAGRQVNVVAVLDEPVDTAAALDPWSTPGDPREIARQFTGWAARLRGLLAAAPHWSRWPLADRAALPWWSQGAVTLLGDAAHPMLPFLAQGAAQALEDAAALGRAVTASLGDLPGAFRRYETERRPRTAKVQAASRRQATLYHLSGPLAVARDLFLSGAPASGLMAGYDWLYRTTS